MKDNFSVNGKRVLMQAKQLMFVKQYNKGNTGCATTVCLLLQEQISIIQLKHFLKQYYYSVAVKLLIPNYIPLFTCMQSIPYMYYGTLYLSKCIQ